MNQITEDRLKVDYDTYNMTIDELNRRYGSKIDVAPDYQRHFVWDDYRQSRLIESILLGIPLPDIFMAYSAEKEGAWEVVDGVQRITTIVGFCNPDLELLPENIKRQLTIKLTGLKTLSYLNGLQFKDFDPRTQQFFLDRAVKITLLNDKSDEAVRYELFERLNTGGISLEDQELRNAVFRGKFTDLIARLSDNESFRKLVPDKKITNSAREEYVLKFFAYLDWHTHFIHSVEQFLRSYTRAASDYVNESPDALKDLENQFISTMNALAKFFPEGINRGRNRTPVNLYEAITVAAAIAIKNEVPILMGGKAVTQDEELKKATTGATNSKASVRNRISRAYHLLTGETIDLSVSPRNPIIPFHHFESK